MEIKNRKNTTFLPIKYKCSIDNYNMEAKEHYISNLIVHYKHSFDQLGEELQLTINLKN